MASSQLSTDEVVKEIMRIHGSLPTRPDLDELEAARALIQNVDKEEKLRLEILNKQRKSPEVPQQLFDILKDMQKNRQLLESAEQKRDALKILDLEAVHAQFDHYVEKALKCVSSPSFSSTPADYSNSSQSTVSSSFSSTTPTTPSVAGLDSVVFPPSSRIFSEKEFLRSSERLSRDDSYVMKSTPKFLADGIGVGVVGSESRPRIVDASLRPSVTSDQDGEKLSLIKLASLIEASQKRGKDDLDLRNKLLPQIEWLPESIGKLSSLIKLDLSENRIAVLPATIGGLKSLERLDLHSNQIANLPDSIGSLFGLVYLALRGNQLTSIPASIGNLAKLEELDLSSNMLNFLPETIGGLVKLKKLNVDTNNLEEIPCRIDECVSLVEFRADYNRLKALPEAAGKLEKLEILSVRYNNIKQLPTTMGHLRKLREIDVSFNELESVPESLCLATTLIKMNVGNNFADLRALPRGIGNLENLEELDISNNQIRYLPETFRMLTKLRVLDAAGDPLEVPPRSVAEQGAQAVVQYMAELVSKTNVSQPVKKKSSWSFTRIFSKSSKTKQNSLGIGRV